MSNPKKTQSDLTQMEMDYYAAETKLLDLRDHLTDLRRARFALTVQAAKEMLIFGEAKATIEMGAAQDRLIERTEPAVIAQVEEVNRLLDALEAAYDASVRLRVSGWRG
jgi:ATP-dependent protease HslVU (ClpYQ) ATPase subunit